MIGTFGWPNDGLGMRTLMGGLPIEIGVEAARGIPAGVDCPMRIGADGTMDGALTSGL